MTIYNHPHCRAKRRTKTRASAPIPSQSVLIEFNYWDENLDPLYDLEDELDRVIRRRNLGHLDGHEVAMEGGDGRLYLYGFNAEHLFKAIKPILEKTFFMKGATALLTFGRIANQEKEIEIRI